MKFVNTQSIKNLNDTFLGNVPQIGKLSQISKVPPGGVVPVVVLKLKMSLFAYLTFSISPLLPGGVFPL